MREKTDPQLVADGHRLVVYVPEDLLRWLQHLAVERATGARMSVSHVVRELLEKQRRDEPPAPDTRDTRKNSAKRKGNHT